jgi:hypothetical protein
LPPRADEITIALPKKDKHQIFFK